MFLVFSFLELFPLRFAVLWFLRIKSRGHTLVIGVILSMSFIKSGFR